MYMKLSRIDRMHIFALFLLIVWSRIKIRADQRRNRKISDFFGVCLLAVASISECVE